MKSMPSHPRLFFRQTTYYHRAAIPAGIKNTYPKSEETFSLKTGDYQKALKLVREAAAMADRKSDQHRREQARLAEPYVSDLSDAEIKHIGKAYYASILKEAAFA